MALPPAGGSLRRNSETDQCSGDNDDLHQGKINFLLLYLCLKSGLECNVLKKLARENCSLIGLFIRALKALMPAG
jgi:hypothetical protein